MATWQVMSYLLEQLQAYQHQLKELELHAAWRQHTTANAAPQGPPLTLPPISPGGGMGGGGMGGGGSAPQHISSTTVWAVAPPSSLQGPDGGYGGGGEYGGGGGGGYGGCGGYGGGGYGGGDGYGGVAVPLAAPLRPYGKRAPPPRGSGQAEGYLRR